MTFKKPQQKTDSKTKDKNFVQRPLTGALFENDKGGVESRPDYKGHIVTDKGQKFWLSGWQHTSESGIDYISFSLDLAE